jgi:regulator of sigma D
VIEFLSQREGGGQLRFPMPLGQLKYDNNALAAIRNLHTVHRSRAERQIAEAIAANFETLRDGAVAAINSIWEASIGRVHGLTRAEHFFQKLQAKLEWYRNMMDTEAKEERTKDRALNFKSAEDQITEAVGAFFRRDARIRTACETYGGIVDRQTVLTISVARLEKAAELYAALHAHAQSVLNACERIRENLNASRRNFEQQHQDAKSSRGTSRLFEQVVEFDAAASRPAIAGADFVKWYADHSGSLSQWSKLRADEVHRDIEEFVRNRYEPLAALTVEDILRRSTPEEVGQELKRLDNLSVPLWRHDIGRIPVISQTVINELHHYGIADAESSVLKDAKYAAAVPRGNSLPSMVSTRDPQRIVLFKVKTGLPLFALSDIEDLERAYLDPGKIISSHIHRKWSDLPNLIPRSGDGEALRWFALAQAPEPFGLIQRIGNWYSMRSKSGRRVDDNMVRLAQGRVPAYTTFEKNRELVQEAKEVIDGVVTREGRGKVIQLLKDYSESLSRQMSGAVEPAVKDQVESEIVAIEEYVRKMETLS